MPAIVGIQRDFLKHRTNIRILQNMFRQGSFTLFRVLAASAPDKNLFFFLGSISSSMAPETPCFNQLWSAIILKNVTARKVNSYIRKTCSEYYTVPPGFVFRGVPILLKAPMLVGLEMKKKKILLPFSKPCYGTMLFELDAAAEDFLVLRSALGTGKAKKEPKR
jgi:hypothetical protein